MAAERQPAWNDSGEFAHPLLEIVSLDTTRSNLSSSPNLSVDDIDDIIRSREISQVVKTKAKSNRVRNIFAGAVLAVSMATGAKPVMDGLSFAANIQSAVEQNDANWRNAGLSSDAFLAKYKDQLIEKTNISAVFIPEEEGATLSNMNTKYGDAAFKQAENTLDYMHNELNMNSVTIGIREVNFVDAKGNYIFDYYKPFLDKIFQYKMDVNLILGIKTPGWKEQHPAPQDEQELLQIAANGGVVYANSKLAQDDLKHQTEFFKFLLANYSKEDLNLITGLEFQNEFNNHFGNADEQVVFDENVIVMDAENSKQFLPGRRIFVSSAGPLNIDPVISAVKALKSDNPNMKVGISIHDYSVDAGDFPVPIIGSANWLNTPAGRFSPLTYDKMAFNELQKVAMFCNKTINCREIIGEAEGKAWDGNVGLPGDKVTDFHYELLNSMQILDAGGDATNNNQKKQINYWGIWDLIRNKNNPDNKIIINEIKKINTKDKNAIVNYDRAKASRVGGESVTLVNFTIC
jgi:hypothetical protein